MNHEKLLAIPVLDHPSVPRIVTTDEPSHLLTSETVTQNDNLCCVVGLLTKTTQEKMFKRRNQLPVVLS
jgi:hypothetical protein